MPSSTRFASPACRTSFGVDVGHLLAHALHLSALRGVHSACVMAVAVDLATASFAALAKRV